jgi:hypothetical protein
MKMRGRKPGWSLLAIPDGAEGTAKQMDWLAQHPRYRHLLNRMVLIINHIRPASHRRDRMDTGALVTTLALRAGISDGRAAHCRGYRRAQERGQESGGRR